VFQSTVRRVLRVSARCVPVPPSVPTWTWRTNWWIWSPHSVTSKPTPRRSRPPAPWPQPSSTCVL